MQKNLSNSNVYSENFKAIFEFVPMGVILTDQNGQVIAINPFVIKEFGYLQKELVGKELETLITPRFHQNYTQYRNRYLENRKPGGRKQGIELLGLRKDKTEFPARICLGHYMSNGSEFVITFITDIFLRKGAESEIEKLNSELEFMIAKRTKDLHDAVKQLENTNNRLEEVLSFKKALLDTAGTMIIATDKEGIINLFNPEAVRMLGYSQDEILGKKTPILFHTEKDLERKRKQLSDEFGIKVKNGFDVLVEKARRHIYDEEQYNYVDKIGNSFPVSLTITALRNSKEDIRGFIAIAVDISERIKAEIKLKKAEHLFSQLLNNYPDGIISIIDQDYHFIYTGGDLHKQLNADISMLIGKEIFPFFPEVLRQSILPILASVFQNKKNIIGFELPHPIADGIYIMDAFPLIEEDGSVNNIGVIIRNISKLKQAEKNLREDLKIERDLNELKSRFVSMASHEFRTPLSTVLSSTYLIEKYTSVEDQQKREKHLKRIISSVNMLTDILNDFLSLGKIEEGKLYAKFSEFDLQEMIESLIDEIKNNLKKNQTIHFIHEGDSTVSLDPSLLKHIIMNLVSNASKFSSDNSHINIKSSNKNGHFMLSVKDNGIGITEEDQQHLMERFFRAQNAQNIQGTGLGLHIVSKYGEMMNGDLQFKSELGKGTEFTITFKPMNEA